MKDNIKSVVDKINNYKLQVIINKSLFKDNVINVETYEITESSLLEKIEHLSNELELSI